MERRAEIKFLVVEFLAFHEARLGDDEELIASRYHRELFVYMK